MSTENKPAATATAEKTVNEAPVIPGRKEVLEHFAQEIEGAYKTPGEKVAAATADGEKQVLSQVEADKKVEETPEQKTAREATEATGLAERAKVTGLTVEEQKAAETQALTELTERATAAGKTVDEQFAIEEAAEAAAAGGKTRSDEDHLADDADLKKGLTPETQEKINRRIGKEVAKTKLATEAKAALETQLAEAQRQLAERPRVEVPRSSVPLGHVNDAAGLKAEETKAREAVKQVRELKRSLRNDPAGVEQVLKEAKVNLAEFTPEAMTDYLERIEENANATLTEGIPARTEFLKGVGTFSSEAIQLMPALKDAKSPERAQFNQVLAKFPQLKDHPYWPMAVRPVAWTAKVEGVAGQGQDPGGGGKTKSEGEAGGDSESAGATRSSTEAKEGRD